MWFIFNYCFAELIIENMKNVCPFYTISQHRDGKGSWNHPPILHSQYNECEWACKAWNQGISSHCTDLVIPECYGFIPRGMNAVHDDVIKWKNFPRNWPFVREFTGHRWILLTKPSDAELSCFLWSELEQTVEQSIRTPVIWCAMALIMTSL